MQFMTEKTAVVPAGRLKKVFAVTRRGETLVKKFKECVRCEFYKEVKKEEGLKFVLSPKLLRIIRSEKIE